MAAKLKLFRLMNSDASYDDLHSAVVWAESPEDAVAVLTDWYEKHDYGDTSGIDYGDWCGPYTATEVAQERKVVLTHVLYG